jgi:ribonuclease HIII
MPLSLKLSIKNTQEQRRLRDLAWKSGFSWTEKPEQYCAYRLDGKLAGGWVRIKQFTNGTLYIEASTDALLHQLANAMGLGSSLPPLTSSNTSPVASSVTSGSASSAPAIVLPYFGSDETGKGDYFGPLVVACVYVDDTRAKALEALGVKDSKQLNAQSVSRIAEAIPEVLGADGYAVLVLEPKRYNALYQDFKAQGKNLNHLLGWCHATLLDQMAARQPSCPAALVDRFGDDRYVCGQLQGEGRKLKVTQFPRAEAYTAVAAASILARQYFVNAVKALSAEWDMDLPLGAGAPVLAGGKRFIQKHGADNLVSVAKLHFKTTTDLGL